MIIKSLRASVVKTLLCCSIAAMFFCASGLAATGATDAKKTSDENDSYQYTLLLTRVIELVRQEYADDGKVSYKELTYNALRGMLSSLDPHSQFLDEEAFSEMQKDTKGEFSGLGLVVGMKDGFVTVISPIEDTPSSRAGIMPGDRILKINGRSTDKMSLAEAIKNLKGAKGEPALLAIFRPATDEVSGLESGDLFEINVVRDIIKVPTLRKAELLPVEIAGDYRIGYIRLEQFGEKTPEDFSKALNMLEQKGMQALILDLRNNPGGLLDAAVDVAGAFLPQNQVIVSTHGRSQVQETEYKARIQKQRPNYPIAVLVNAYSASGAEIVAGALKDLRRAIIIGEKTFGKGSVQSVQDLGQGIGVRLTTAKYYTPAKSVIHEVGVMPDITAPVTAQEEKELNAAKIRRSQSAQSNKKQPQQQQAAPQISGWDAQDSLLERAAAIIKGLLVYGQMTNVAKTQ